MVAHAQRPALATSRSQRDAVHEYGHTGSNQKSTTLGSDVARHGSPPH